jgi:hypothetical protein
MARVPYGTFNLFFWDVAHSFLYCNLICLTFNAGCVTCPSSRTHEWEDSSSWGPQVQTSAGQPHGGLGCESKCWTWFDSQFDNIHESHRCQQMRVWKEGPKEVSLVQVLGLNTSMWLGCETRDGNSEQRSLEPLEKSITSWIPLV